MTTAGWIEAIAEPLIRRDNGQRSIQVRGQLSRSCRNVVCRLRVGNRTYERMLGELGAGRHSFGMDVEDTAEEVPLVCEFRSEDGLLAAAASVMRPVKRWTVHLMHQSHYDIGYTDVQTEINTLQKQNLDDVLDYIEATAHEPEDSRFRWTAECTYPVMQYIEDRSAASVRRLTDAARGGQLELAAALFTLHGEYCSQEELIRSFYPAAELRKRGIDVTTAIQSDVPGTPSLVPRLLNAIGIRRLAMAPNNFRAPFHRLRRGKLPRPFRWTSGYGDQVMVWYTDLYDHVYQEGNILGFLEGVAETEKYLPGRLNALEAEGHPGDVIAFRIQGSYSDNGRPNLRIAQTVKAWNEKYAWPRVRMSTFGQAMDDLERSVGPELPVVKGEWPDWWAEGVGAAARELATIRRSQDRAAYAQTMYAMLSADSKETYPEARLRRAWELLLLSDEHTWGAADPTGAELRGIRSGGLQWSMKQSYVHHADLETARLEESACRLAAERLAGDGGPTVVVSNSLGWPRTDTARISAAELVRVWPGSTGWRIRDRATGLPVVCQSVSGDNRQPEVVFVAESIPAFGCRAFDIEPVADGSPASGETDPTRDTWRPILENAYYRIETCERSGAIVGLTDKTQGCELIARHAPFRLGQVIRQKLNRRHFFFLDDEVVEQQTDGNAKVEAYERGPVFDRLLHTADCGPIAVRREIRLYHALRKIDLVVTMSKPDSEETEAVFIAFPLSPERAELRVETLGGAFVPGRDQLPGSSVDWIVARKYADVSGTDFGITVALVDSPLVHVGDIRSPSERSDDGGCGFYAYVQNNLWATNFPSKQSGETRYAYSLGVHGPDYDPVYAERFAAQAVTPLRVSAIGRRPGGGHADARSGISKWLDIEGDPHVHVTAAAKTGKEMIVRVAEYAGRSGRIALSFPAWAVAGAIELNPIEEPIGPVPWNGTRLELELQPKEIKTIRLEMR